MAPRIRLRIARRPRGCFLLIAGGLLSACVPALMLSYLSNRWLPSHSPAPDRFSAAETVYAEHHEEYPWPDDAFARDWQQELDLLADAVQAENGAGAAALAARFLDLRR